MNKKAIGVILLLLGIGVPILSFTIWLRVNIALRQDVYGWYKMAYAAGHAEQMREYLDKLLVGMDKWDMKEGHYALFIKNPENDIVVDREIFDALRARLAKVQEYNMGSMDYAESLEDIRRQMDKTGFSPGYWYWANVHPWFLGFWISFGHVFCLLAIIFGLECVWRIWRIW